MLVRAHLIASILVLVVLTGLLSGCGGGGGGATATPPAATSAGATSPATVTAATPTPANVSQEALTTVIVRSDLAAKQVPASVTEMRFTGVDAAGEIRYGPTTRTKAAEIVLANVPVSVTSIRIELLRGGLVVGADTAAVNLTANQTVTVDAGGFTVLVSTLERIDVTPATPSAAAGTSLQLHATGTFTDGATADVTDQAQWSSNSAIAQVSNTAGSIGLARGVKPGSTTITATLSGVSGGVTLRVTDATLTGITLSPTSLILPKGTDLQLSATASFSDGSTHDVTRDARWQSAGNVSVDVHGRLHGDDEGSGSVTATFGGFSASAPATVSGAALVRLQVTPAADSVPRGLTLPLTATAVYSDGATVDVTAGAVWTSSRPAVASMEGGPSSPQLVRANDVGRTTVTASLPGAEASVELSVTGAVLQSIAVTPDTPSVAAGGVVRFSAVGTYSDASTAPLTADVSWTSTNTAVASVSNGVGSQGVAATLAPGTTTVRATLGDVSHAVTLTVTPATLTAIQITPARASLAAGTDLPFTATGIWSDHSTRDITADVSWQSAGSSVASFTGTRLTAVAEGTTDVTATLSGVSATTPVTVTSATLTAIAVQPGGATFPVGSAVQVRAVGYFSDGSTQDLTASVSWSASNAKATIASPGGRASMVAAGTVTFTATQGGLSGQATVDVTSATLEAVVVHPAGATFARGTTLPMTATGVYSDGTTLDLTSSASWSSSAPEITIAAGLATATSPATATVTASWHGVSGTATVHATSAALSAIVLSPATPSVASGTSVKMHAQGVFSDGTTQDLTSTVSWSSSTLGVATISSPGGLATTAAAGTTTVTAALGGLTASVTLTVTPATLTSIVVTPAWASIAKGTDIQLHATGFFSDGTTQDLTATTTFTSSDPTKLSVLASGGLARGVSSGSVTVSASQGSVTGTTPLTVTAATLQAIVVTPAAGTLPVGVTAQMQATGIFSDGSTQDLTATASWTSSAVGKATVTSPGGLVAALATGTATVTATFGGVSGAAGVTVSAASLETLYVTPSAATVPVGVEAALHATGVYSDGTTRDLTAGVSWHSADASRLVVAADGRASALGTGTVQVTATSGAHVATTTVAITSASVVSLVVTPAHPSLARGGSRLQMHAAGILSDGTTVDLTDSVSWSSSDATVLAVDPARGGATSFAPGTATVTASYGGRSAATDVTVTPATLQSIILEPVNASLPRGGCTLAMKATGVYSDGTTADVTSAASWTSGDVSLATVSGGVVTSGDPGTVEVRATVGAVSTQASLVITPASLASIVVTPAGSALPLGVAMQARAFAVFDDGTTQDVTNSASWVSSDSAVAAVSSVDGRVTAIGPGSARLTATLLGVSGRAGLTVTSATLQAVVVTPNGGHVGVGNSLQMRATGVFSDGTTQDVTATATWSTADAAVAAVGADGLVLTTGTGSVAITAAKGGAAGSATLDVTSATLTSIVVTPHLATLARGTQARLKATGLLSDGTSTDLTASVTWSSADTDTATVDSDGLATAGATPGTVRVRATSGAVQGFADLTVTSATLESVVVSPAGSTLPVGVTARFKATGLFSDGSVQDVTTLAAWSSSAPAHAAVTGTGGDVSALAAGAATISASYGGIAGSSSVMVTGATLRSVAVTPGGATLPAGVELQLHATGVYSDGSTQDLTASAAWTSSDAARASVSTDGRATAVAAGAAQITATVSGHAARVTITVTSATLTSVVVTPAVASVAQGGSRLQLRATGVYSDGTAEDITSTVTWSSADASVLSVDPSSGLATSAAPGTASVTATKAGQGGSASITVTTATLASIVLTPAGASVPSGATLQVHATGIYTDGTTADVTSSASWTTDDGSLAAVSDGLVTGVAAGTAQLRASLGGIVGTTPLTVTSAHVASIVVTPAGASVPMGVPLQLHATAVFDDGSAQDVTTAAAWSTSDGTVAAISTGGVATGGQTGTVTCTATWLGVAGQGTLTVNAATLHAIVVTPHNASLGRNNRLQMHASGMFSDGTTQDITSTATWSTSDATRAGIVSDGLLLSGAQSGPVTVTATRDGVSASTSLTVTAATLTSIVVTPNATSLARGASASYKATGVMSDGTASDVTSLVTWSSSATSTVTVDGTGRATAGATAGPARVQASMSGVSGHADVTVTTATLSSLVVSPGNVTLPAGVYLPARATAVYSDGTTTDVTASASWSSSAIAVVDFALVNGSLLPRTRATGTSTLTASYLGVVGSGTVHVDTKIASSVVVTPNRTHLPGGVTTQLHAYLVNSDGSLDDMTAWLTWSSSDASLATVSSTGLVTTGSSTGTVHVQASSGALVGTADITIDAAGLTSAYVSPAHVSLPRGGHVTRLQLQGVFADGVSVDASGLGATWSSSDTAVATVDASGAVTTGSTGTATVTADLGGGITATSTVTVTPAILTSVVVSPASGTPYALGTRTRYQATGVMSDGTFLDLTSTATWTSSTPAVASVDGTGLVSALSAGTSTITATFNGASGSATMTVTAKQVASVSITPHNPSMPLHTTLQFRATAYYTDGTTDDVTHTCTWTAPRGGSVSSAGLFSYDPPTASDVEIVADFGGRASSETIHVTTPTLQSISLQPASASMAKGTTQQFTAFGTFSDGTTAQLSGGTWSTTNSGLLTVSLSGLATAVGAGSCSASYTLDGQSGAAPVTTSAAKLQSLSFSGDGTDLVRGNVKQFIVVGTFSDGTTRDVTSMCTWWSASSAVYFSSATPGLALGANYGSATITALDPASGIWSSVLVTVDVNPSRTLLIANGDKVSCLNLTTSTVSDLTRLLPTWPSWSTPTVGTLAADLRKNRLYVHDSANRTLWRYTMSSTPTLTAGSTSYAVDVPVVSVAENRLYLVDQHDILFGDLNYLVANWSGRTLSSNLGGLAIDESYGLLWYTASDTTSGYLIRDTPAFTNYNPLTLVNGPGARRPVVDPYTHYVYVPIMNGGNNGGLEVYRPDRTLVASYPYLNGFYSCALHPRDNKLLLNDRYGGRIWVWDTVSQSMITSYPVGDNLRQGLAVDPVTNCVYAALESRNLVKLDLTSGSTTTIPIPGSGSLLEDIVICP